MQIYLKDFSEKLFQDLKSDEQLGLILHSEESTFIRFNKSLVRQNSTVNQHEITLQFHKDQRFSKMRLNLSLDLNNDLQNARMLLIEARTQLPQIDPHPQFFKLVNNGQSEITKKIDRLGDEEIPQLINQVFSDSDLAGLWCSGPMRRASVNSEGQFHFFESDNFFFDYSIYNGPLAAKGYYASEKFNEKDFTAQAQDTKNKLSLLSRPQQKIARGQYKVYLEPMAVAEIVENLAYGSLSQGAFNSGYAPLKKLKNKELLFSEKFDLYEDFNLGYVPLFNSAGEISEPKIELIKKGQLESLLISTETAQEYNLKSNQADASEQARSLTLGSGALKQADALKKLGQGLYLSNLHYINYSDIQTARLTGMTRFACFWVENGEIQGPIQDLRFDESLYNIFGSNLVDLTEESSVYLSTSTYLKRSLGALKVPGALINNFNFTL